MRIIGRLIVPILAIGVAIYIITNGQLTYDNLANELFGAFLFTFIFFLVQNTFAPHLRISGRIAKYKVKKKKYEYYFKFVNLSISSIRDVKILVLAPQMMSVPDGTIKKVKDLPIDIDYIHSVNGFFSSFRKEHRNNTCIIKLPREVENILSDHTQSIEIRISCRDAIVGRENTFIMSFYNENVILEGKFKFGLSTKIV
ncbi:hypothetical protein [Ulvibacterium sp.]|uniref:hypothetical protein n=1 Tax=Ulvibacterium sp. TaxID=2665914 RepID=UPI00262B30CD|nr:hypothetical protein [Ulvibacterium sp.]